MTKRKLTRGERIRLARQAQQLSQVGLARLLKLNQSTVSKVEANDDSVGDEVVARVEAFLSKRSPAACPLCGK